MELKVLFQHEKSCNITAQFDFNSAHIAIPRQEDQVVVRTPESRYYDQFKWAISVERNFLMATPNPGMQITVFGKSDSGELCQVAAFTQDSTVVMVPRPGDEIEIEPSVYQG